MTVNTAIASDLKVFAAEVRRRANLQYATPQHARLFGVPLTIGRARLWALQMSLWTRNRRDCWAYAQALAPLDVKSLIWAHEEDELAGSRSRGTEDHFTLQVHQGGLLGLTPEDYRSAQPEPGTRTCAYAWIHLVKDAPWLKAVGACAGLEISNSADWVDGGGMSFRKGKRLEEQLGIPFEKQVSDVEHAEVDVEHANMLMQVAAKHGSSQSALDLLLEGVVESWELETIWKGVLADMMEALPNA